LRGEKNEREWVKEMEKNGKYGLEVGYVIITYKIKLRIQGKGNVEFIITEIRNRKKCRRE
jgi:hypothetical protein